MMINDGNAKNQWLCKNILTCLFANFDPDVMAYNSFDGFPKSAKSLAAI